MKWPLTWEKNVFHQPVLFEYFRELHYKASNVNKFYLEGHHDFFCQTFAKWIKIIVKIFEKVCQNSDKVNQFYLKRKLNWISEKCITSQCSLKVLEGSLFFIFIASVHSTQRIPGFSMSYFCLNFKFIWIKHGNLKRKTLQNLLLLRELTVILHLKLGTKIQPFLVRTRILCANTEKKLWVLTY